MRITELHMENRRRHSLTDLSFTWQLVSLEAGQAGQNDDRRGHPPGRRRGQPLDEVLRQNSWHGIAVLIRPGERCAESSPHHRQRNLVRGRRHRRQPQPKAASTPASPRGA